MTPFLKQNPHLAGNLFVAIGHENTQKEDALVEQLKASAPGSFRWRFKHYKDENHFSVPLPSMYDGLRFIYSNWFIDIDQLATYNELQDHCTALSGQYGYIIEPTQDLVKTLATNNFEPDTLMKPARVGIGPLSMRKSGAEFNKGYATPDFTIPKVNEASSILSVED